MSHLEKVCQPASPDLPLRLWDMTEVPLWASVPMMAWTVAPGGTGWKLQVHRQDLEKLDLQKETFCLLSPLPLCRSSC